MRRFDFGGTLEAGGAARHVRMVGSFEELIAARFEGEINALCWPRALAGDFQEVLRALGSGPGMTAIEDEDLQALELSSAGCVARDVLLADQAMMRSAGLQPELNCIGGYERDLADGPVATDVYSFHTDSATVEADTYLCTYVGAASEGLANGAAIRRVDDIATRAALLAAYCGADDAGFAAYLREGCFDLHYVPREGAVPYGFGVGNLWRLAIAHPESVVAPCIHRAPLTLPGDPARLLLIS